jgi:hypothetical protein
LRSWLRYVHVDPLLAQPYFREDQAAWHGVILPVEGAGAGSSSSGCEAAGRDRRGVDPGFGLMRVLLG